MKRVFWVQENAWYEFTPEAFKDYLLNIIKDVDQCSDEFVAVTFEVHGVRVQSSPNPPNVLTEKVILDD
jgi:hypothetical protein